MCMDTSLLVIAKDLFMDIYSDKQQNSRLIVEQYMPNILSAVDRLGLGDFLIIRSSGVKRRNDGERKI